MRILQKSKKKIILITIIAVVVIGGASAYAFYALRPSNSDTNEVNYDPPTEEQSQEGEQTTEQREPAQEPTPPPDTNGETKKVDISITAASQAGPTLQVRTMIQDLNPDGTCTLVLSRPNHTSVRQQAGTQALSSYSSCQGFDIDVSHLARGDWTMTLTYNGNNATGTATQTINLN